jgi:hypothetical protein
MDPVRPRDAEAFACGVADQELSSAGVPARREVLTCNDNLASGVDLLGALEAGRLLVSRERYGIVCGWKKSEGQFRGVLLQHKSVMEDRTFETGSDLRAWYLTTVFAVE